MTIVVGADYESEARSLSSITQDGAVAPLDVTGWTIRAEFSEDRRANVTPLLAVDNATSGNGVVIDTAATGLFRIVLTAAQTAALRPPGMIEPYGVRQMRIGLFRTDGGKRQLIGDLIEMVAA